MKEQSKARKEAYQKKQEEHGKKVIYSIFIALGLGALAFMIWTAWLVG